MRRIAVPSVILFALVLVSGGPPVPKSGAKRLREQWRESHPDVKTHVGII